MKVGLIGLGSIGQRHHDNMKKMGIDVVVWTERNDLQNMAIVKNWKSFVNSGPYDVIFVTNEPFRHLPTIQKCLPLNPKAFFVEKPFSHSSKNLVQLSKILKKKNISLFVGYNFQFFKPLQEIKRIIQSQKLGRIYYLRVFVGQDLRQWRKRDYRLNYAAKKKQGGGVMLDLIHEINYSSWILNEKLIPKTAVIKKISNLEIETEDCADSIFVSEKGTVVSIHQDYLRIPLKRSLDIIGEKGSLEWDYEENTITIQTKEKIIDKKNISERNEMFLDELKFFFGLIKKNKFFSNIDEAIRDIINIEYLKRNAKK